MGAKGSVVLTPAPAKKESVELPEVAKPTVVKEERQQEAVSKPEKAIEAPSAEVGERLHLVIHRATELENKGLMGKSDPYIVVKYQGQKYKSKTVKNNQNPVWDFAVDMNVNPKVSNKIDLVVYDKDIMKDDVMGSAVLDVQDLLECGIVENKCIDLEKCKSGKLYVSAAAGDLVLPAPVAVAVQPAASEEPAQEKPKDAKQAATVVAAVPAVETEEPERLQLIVHRGSDLVKTDIIGKSDPYVVVQYQDKKFKSKTVKNTQEPVWDFVVNMPVYRNKADKVSISVFDSDIGKDDAMGTTVLDVPELLESGNVENRCIKLDKCKSGLLYVSYAKGSVVLTPAPAKKESVELPEVAKPTVVKEERQQEAVSKPEKAIEAQSAEVGERLHLVIHRASELENKGLMGKSDPYIVVKYQGQKYKSKTVKNNQNPVWDFAVDMNVNPKVSNKIDVVVYDKDIMKDDVMGSAVLDVQDLLECGIVENKCIDLEKCKSGKLYVSAAAGDLVLPAPVAVAFQPAAAEEPAQEKPKDAKQANTVVAAVPAVET